MNSEINIPVAAIIPTYNRSVVLQKTLATIAIQKIQFAEIIIVDASDDNLTSQLCSSIIPNLYSKVIYQKAIVKGAAAQRNQAVQTCTQPYLCFMDDDVYLEQNCIEKLWQCITSNPKIGGVNAMITNQQYYNPGTVTKFMYKILSGENLATYAGKIIGPAWNLLPQDDANMPEYNKVEWLNLGCTMYKLQALPTPPFQSHFTGYSLMEDATLSIEVSKNWELYNVRTAKLYHDSQQGNHKNNIAKTAKMQLINRHYVMTKILNRTGFKNYAKLFLFELFGLVTSVKNIAAIKLFFLALVGKLQATIAIIKQ